MKRPLGGIILVLVGLTATVYGATVLFMQTFPVVPATAIVVIKNCALLVPVPNQVAPGSSGGVSFGCSNSTAFNVTNDGVATPTFNLPAPYTGVALIGSTTAPTTACSTFTGPTVLTSGSPFSFTGQYGRGNKYNYCVAYTGALADLPTFDVTWTQ